MKRTISVIIVLVAAWLTASAQQAAYVPSEENLKARQEFQDNKLGVFIHWGVYSMLADGEWVMLNKRIDRDEYAQLPAGFYPSRFDADEWVRAIKDAGARYITITSRHHDGFSMFKSAASDYNIVDATPFKRDVLKELADACQRHGIKLHFYYSHLDWHRLDYPLGRHLEQMPHDPATTNWPQYYQFMNDQLTELLTNYGPIGAIWFDGKWEHDTDPTPFDWQLDEQYALIHRLQPSCLIGNNHHEVPFPGEDIQIFEQDVPGENTAGYSGENGISQLPLETCMTMNRTWGYRITDKNYKSGEEIIRTMVKAAGRNGNLLINVGPRPDGCLPTEAVERLHQLGEWMRANGESIYGTRGGIIPPHDWGVTTQKGNTLYVHILNLKDDAIYLPLNAKRVKQARLFSDKTRLRCTATGNGVTITLPAVPTAVDEILEITLTNK